MKQNRKMLYLNRTIVTFMLIGYSAFLTLLLVMDWNQINNYRFQKKQVEMNALSEYVKQLKSEMEDINLQFYNISANDSHYNALQKEEGSALEFSHAYDLRKMLNDRMLLEEKISSYFIFYHNLEKAWYNFSSYPVDVEYATELKENIRQYVLSNPRGSRWFSVQSQGITSIALSYGADKAAIVGLVDISGVKKKLQDQMEDGMEIMLMESGEILENESLASFLELPDLVEEYTDSFETVKWNHQIYGCRVPNMNLWICAAYPVHMWASLTYGQIILLILTMVALVTILILLLFIFRQVVKPLRQLTSTMNDIRNGKNEEVPPMDSRFHEFQVVNDTLGQMVKELEERKLQVYEENIAKQKAQIQYLQLQLKPHFYLNGLKTLNVLAMDGQTEKMQDLIMNLSSHLRYFLQAEREIVPLSAEVEFVKNYVNMQKHVTGRPVELNVYQEEGLDNWEVPILCLQTFVENSIKYARFGDSSMPLQIEISISLLKTDEEEFLDLCVQDNGQGYSEEILKEINGDPMVGDRCVGINNIKRRCLFFYGGKAEYTFMSFHGALSELIIPKHRLELKKGG